MNNDPIKTEEQHSLAQESHAQGAAHSAHSAQEQHAADAQTGHSATQTDNHTDSHAAAHTEAHAAGHGEHNGEVPKEKVFDHLLGELGDHHELNIAFSSFDVLPVILYDDQGLHFWANNHAVEEGGRYQLFHTEEKELKAYNGKFVRTENGQIMLVNGKPVTPAFDLSVTNLVAFQWLGMIIMIAVFLKVGSRYKKNPKSAPKGIQNAIETLVIYIRDEIVRPNLGTKRLTNQLLPYFLALFFFIFVLDYIGLIPGMHTATAGIGVTAALAITAFFVVNITAIKEAGIGAWFHHLLGGAPVYLAPIMVPIEIIGLFTKPFALTIRLFANMTAGHVVLLSLIGLVFLFRTLGVAPVTILFSVFVYFLETLVCFLQAYIFTMLTAVFVGLAIGDHKHEDPHHAHH